MEAGTVVECGGGKGEGDAEVVLDVWKWREDVYWEAFCCAGYGPHFHYLSKKKNLFRVQCRGANMHADC